MNHWLFMFKPDTYECVKQHNVVGVLANHAARFREVQAGDPFLVYVSRVSLLDARGKIEGEVFEGKEQVFGDKSDRYPHRAPVCLLETGFDRDGSKLLYGLSEFQSGLNTSPGNYLNCMGGFLRITEEDYDWLLGCMRGEIQPEWEHSEPTASA